METAQQQQSGSENTDDYFGGNKVCAFCKGRSANWYCFGCHHWFHHGKQSPILKTRLQLNASGLNKKAVTCISCYSYMHPMIFGKSDFFAHAEFNNDKIQELSEKQKDKNKKNKRSSSALTTITETETSITAADTTAGRDGSRGQNNTTIDQTTTSTSRGSGSGRTTNTTTTRMSTRSNQEGRFIGKRKRLRR